MFSDSSVFVVDNDASFRQSLTALVRSMGWNVFAFGSAQEFLDAYDPAQPGCLVADICMPGMSGLELIEELKARHWALPVIFITGHGDTCIAVQAMKAGAVDLLEKPVSPQTLYKQIDHAVDKDAAWRRSQSRVADVQRRLERLTPRERQVMRKVVFGATSKAIAGELGISMKTVEGHRTRVMEKMQAASVADLVRMVVVVGAIPREQLLADSRRGTARSPQVS